MRGNLRTFMVLICLAAGAGLAVAVAMRDQEEKPRDLGPAQDAVDIEDRQIAVAVDSPPATPQEPARLPPISDDIPALTQLRPLQPPPLIAQAPLPQPPRPEVPRPDRSGPDFAEPEAIRPDVAGPDGAGPDGAGPDVAGPDDAGPTASRPVRRAPRRPLVADQVEPIPIPGNRGPRVGQEAIPLLQGPVLEGPSPDLPELEAVRKASPRSLIDEGKAEIVRREGDGRMTLNVQQSDVRKVLELLSEGGNLNILASKNVSGTVTASLTNVDINSALDAILKSSGYVARREQNFIYVGTPEDMKSMQMNSDSIGTRIYRPSYVKASDCEVLITPLLSEVGKVTVSKASQTDIPVDKTKTGGDSFAHNEAVIVHDYEQILEQIDEVITELDCPPPQVAIEAVILSVRLTNAHRLGVNFELLRNIDNARLISGSPLNDLGAIDVTAGGLKFGFLDSSLAIFIEALETVGETDVVASPRLMCLNKQRAEILIGSEFGYVSTTTVTENAATQAIDFLKVGTHLIFRPFISNDGRVRLEVHPELSTGNVRVVQGLTLPDKETTEVTTNIMCHDGRSVIIGGLIREDQGEATSQTPLLGSIPFLGTLFRTRTENLDRREIIVVLTPHIVKEPAAYAEGEAANREFEERSALFADKMHPTRKPHISERYTRLGRAAWNAGDARAAFRYANLAIHYSPLNQNAVNLRSEIIAANPEFDQNINTRVYNGLYPGQNPLKNYTRRGFPWKSERPTPADLELAPGEVYHLED